jgi:excisionase family DNA binding protein
MDYSTNALAELLNIHPDTVRRLARNGRLPGYRVGRQWRFPAEEVARMRMQGAGHYGDELAYIDVDACIVTGGDAAEPAGEGG